MPHQIVFNPDSNTVEITYQGDITLKEVVELYSEGKQVAIENNCFQFLSDYTEATMKLSTVELYDLPKILSEMFKPTGIPIYKLKRALVVSKDLEDYHFFEVVTANQGQDTKVFQDIDDAKEWLKE